MSELDSRIDEIVRALVRDVASGVHSLYRGDIRQQTTQLKLSAFAKEAADKLRAEIRQRAEAMPDHRQHIDTYCPMAVA